MRLPDPERVRPPAVAGTFYPGDPEALRRAVDDHLAAAAPAAGSPGLGRRPKAVIAPHAGYVYSGPVAGSAFAALAAGAGVVRRAVVIGPAHRVPLAGLALPASGRLATPLGELAVAAEAAETLVGAPGVAVSETPHVGEHSLEVELPFLQALFGASLEIVPLVAGRADPETVAAALEAVWGGEETVIVVSSDLSHFLPYERARAVDEETAAAIVALDGPLEPHRACGAVAIDGLLVAARRRGLVARRLDLRNSGDTAGGPDRVVGYGAFAFYERRAGEAGG